MKGSHPRGNPPPHQRDRSRLIAGVVLLSLTCLALQAPAFAADPSTEVVELKGPDVPYYICVQSFYTRISWLYGLGEEHWARLLDELGTRPGTEAETALLDGISRYELELSDRTLDPAPWENDEAAWEVAQAEFLLANVDTLRGIHVETLDRLEFAGVSRWDVDDYINRVVRPSLTLASIGGYEPKDIAPLAGMNDLTLGGAEDE